MLHTEYFNVQSTNKSLTQLSTLTFKGLRAKCTPHGLLELDQNIRASCGLVTQDLLQSVKQECIKRWLKSPEIGGFHVEV